MRSGAALVSEDLSVLPADRVEHVDLDEVDERQQPVLAVRLGSVRQ